MALAAWDLPAARRPGDHEHWKRPCEERPHRDCGWIGLYRVNGGSLYPRLRQGHRESHLGNANRSESGWNSSRVRGWQASIRGLLGWRAQAGLLRFCAAKFRFEVEEIIANELTAECARPRAQQARTVSTRPDVPGHICIFTLLRPGTGALRHLLASRDLLHQPHCFERLLRERSVLIHEQAEAQCDLPGHGFFNH